MTSSILTDFSPAALAHAAKSNLHEFLRYLGRATHTPPLADTKLARWHTQVPYPWFNGVLAARPVEAGDDDMVRAAIDWFSGRGVTHFTWWLASPLPPATWEALLREHGFAPTDGPPGMTMDLGALKAKQSMPTGFTIRPVTDANALQVWTRTFLRGYGLPLAWEAPLLQMMTDLGLKLPVRNYLGYLDGEPAAASTLFLGAGVAGIYCVATLPEARGQGFGSALTLAPLLEARQLGYRIGTLQSSEMGFGVYRRMGFEQVCQVEHFYWMGGGKTG